MALMCVVEEEGRHCIFLYKIKKNSLKKIDSINVNSKIYSIDLNSLSSNEKEIKKQIAFSNNNSINELNVIEKDDKINKRFYNENLEYYDRPPIYYEYCHLSTIERHNLPNYQKYNLNLLTDNENDSFSTASSSSIVLSSGEASTATVQTIEQPINENITNNAITQTNIKNNKFTVKKWHEETVEGLPLDVTCYKNINKKNLVVNNKKIDEQNNNKLKKSINLYNNYLFNSQKESNKDRHNVLKELKLLNFDHYLQRNNYDFDVYPKQQTASENRTHLFFNKFYGPTLLNNWTRSFVTLIYIIYLGFALIGCSQFREGLEPSHLVTADHYIAKYFSDIKSFWKVGAQLHVAILKPPNITNIVER